MTETTGPVQASRFSWLGLARRLPIVVLLLAGGTGLGFLGATQQPATYTATATVLVEPADGNPYSPGTRGQNLANLGTEAQLVSSDAVAKIAKTALRSNASVAALVEQLAVSNPPNSQVLEVAYTDTTPVAARNGANAFANAYLVARERRAAESVQAQINNLTKAQKANQSALQRNVAALAKTATGSPARTLAEQRVASATTEASKLEAQISDLRLFQGDPGQVLSPATVPTGAAGLPPWILPAAGAGLGLLLGLVFAVWRSLNDRKLRTADDVKALGYPVLSTVTTTAGEHPEALLTAVDAELPEGARLLRSVLGVTSPDGGAVLLVPAGAVESHTTTPLVLAAALARADQSVTLVDTDGELTQAAQLTHVKGLSEVLSDGAGAFEVAKEYQTGLRFVPVGIRHSGSVDKLASPQMRSFLDTLAPGSHWLLVAGPIASAPEALTLADLCTDVVILVSLGRTTSVELQHAAEAVTRGGAKLAGIVLDSPEKHRLFHRARHDEAVSERVTVGAPVAALTAASAPASAVSAVDAQTEEIPVIDAALPSATNGAIRAAVNGSSANGLPVKGAPTHGVAANGSATPAPTPWFQDTGDDSGDETDYAASRRSM